MARKQPSVMTVKPRRTYGFRMDGQAWRTLKRKHKAYSKIRRLPCWLAEYGMCLLDGVPIDYDTVGNPDSYETDHKQSRATHPLLAMVWNNLGASHQRCNRSRQSKPVVAQHVWVRPSW